MWSRPRTVRFPEFVTHEALTTNEGEYCPNVSTFYLKVLLSDFNDERNKCYTEKQTYEG